MLQAAVGKLPILELKKAEEAMRQLNNDLDMQLAMAKLERQEKQKAIENAGEILNPYIQDGLSAIGCDSYQVKMEFDPTTHEYFIYVHAGKSPRTDQQLN